MPLPTNWITTPKGIKVLRILVHGDVTGPEAQLHMKESMPGGAYYGQPTLAVVEKGTNLSAESRRVFTSAPRNAFPDAPPNPIAIVIPTAVLRVTIGFILRMSAGGNTRTFGTEEEGIAWLDTQTAAGAA